MIKKIVFLALALLAAAVVSYPTITNAHRAVQPASLFDQR
ncbi:hypothetical protein GLUCOINTEAF2_0202727 [Komagataeibacter intermedius AF2]|uniref:Uncharacterized protein n=1 Tax=Komagataeibacter intermedius AF2 TaxID=1458464 RepID=A0A0N0MEJ6_9PROT|nr:hypothetical protein GLUCOINTEAF2_0202727 [Komagataeibacter intermedius AF2]